MMRFIQTIIQRIIHGAAAIAPIIIQIILVTPALVTMTTKTGDGGSFGGENRFKDGFT